MFTEENKFRRNRTAAVALTALLYGQGLLGFAALAAVLMKERPAEPRPPVVATIVDAQPAS